VCYTCTHMRMCVCVIVCMYAILCAYLWVRTLEEQSYSDQREVQELRQKLDEEENRCANCVCVCLYVIFVYICMGKNIGGAELFGSEGGAGIATEA
jgi:hypothetical protein